MPAFLLVLVLADARRCLHPRLLAVGCREEILHGGVDGDDDECCFHAYLSFAQRP